MDDGADGLKTFGAKEGKSCRWFETEVMENCWSNDDYWPMEAVTNAGFLSTDNAPTKRTYVINN